MPAAASGTLITVAPTGAETAPEAAPGLPVTLQALVAAAVDCEAAGACVVHVHVRDDDGQPSLDPGRLRAAVAALRARTGLLVQLSTGGSVHDPEDARLAVLDAQPDSASCTLGTLNFGDDVFINRWSFVVELHRRMQERGIVAEYECFDLGQVHSLHRLLERHGPPAGGHVHVDLVCGVPGGMAGTPAAVLAAVAALPTGATWSATGVGRSTLPVLLTALAAGGHLRVGMEDTLSFAPDRPVTANAELVTRAADLARLAQRPPLTVAAARGMLGVAEAAQHGAA